MFFMYDQNNSGGFFRGPAYYVIIEAATASDANEIAENDTGIYFHGCRDFTDCRCCGDRWHEAYESEKGDPVPSIYGDPIVGVPNAHGEEGVIPFAIVFYADGRKEYYPEDERERRATKF